MASALPVRSPIIVHHRAALDGRFLPNTLEGITACLEAGAAFVEIDVVALANDDYLLVHDARLESETTGSGPVGACRAATASGLRFARHGADLGYRVPFLSEVVALFLANPGASRLQIDFKDTEPFPTDEPLTRLLRLIEPLAGRVLVSSDADWQLRRLRELAPWLELGLDIQFYLRWRPTPSPISASSFPRQLGAYGYWDDHPLASRRRVTTAAYLADRCGMLTALVPNLSTFFINQGLLVRSLEDGFNWAEALHRRQIKLDAWTIDCRRTEDRENALRLREAGVDQFTTDTPVALMALLGS